MAVEAELAVITRFLDLHEPETFRQQFDLLHDDCVFELPFTGGPIVGKANILQQASGSRMGSWKKGTFVDRVVWPLRQPGRYVVEAKGDMILPHGVAYRNAYVFVFSVKDGKLDLVREFFNPALAREKFAEPPVVQAQ